MTDTSRIFRILVVLQILFSLGDGLAGLLNPSPRGTPGDIFVDSLGLPALIAITLLLVLALAAWLISSVGLLYFKSWARKIYTTVAVGANFAWIVSLVLFGEHDPPSALGEVMTSFAAMATGAVLAMIWMSNIALRFRLTSGPVPEAEIFS
jgi:hypothetical protein